MKKAFQTSYFRMGSYASFLETFLYQTFCGKNKLKIVPEQTPGPEVLCVDNSLTSLLQLFTFYANASPNFSVRDP